MADNALNNAVTNYVNPPFSHTQPHTHSLHHVIAQHTAPVGLITEADEGARKSAYLAAHLKLKQIRKCRTVIKGEGRDKGCEETIKEK